MKAFQNMDNLDKGLLLAKLFPEELHNIIREIEKKCEYFQTNETQVRENWAEKGFFNADYWYKLVSHSRNTIEKNRDNLWKRPRRFADQLFDTYYSIFPIYCLINYAEREHCDKKLKLAIYLLFGSDQIVEIHL